MLRTTIPSCKKGKKKNEYIVQYSTSLAVFVEIHGDVSWTICGEKETQFNERDFVFEIGGEETRAAAERLI